MANKFLEAHNLIQAYELNCNLSIYYKKKYKKKKGGNYDENEKNH